MTCVCILVNSHLICKIHTFFHSLTRNKSSHYTVPHSSSFVVLDIQCVTCAGCVSTFLLPSPSDLGGIPVEDNNVHVRA